MSRILGFIAVLIFAASLVASSLIIRSGLLAIAEQVKEKPMPRFPEQIHLLAGDSKLNVSVGSMSLQPAKNDVDLNVSIDNIRIGPAQLADPHPAAGLGALKGMLDLKNATTEPTK